MSRSARRRVLVVGIYLTDHPNTAKHVIDELGRSVDWLIEQRWAAMGRADPSAAVTSATVARHRALAPKFIVLNRLLAGQPLDDYDYVVLCDDDIALSEGFLDSYLRLVERYDLALSQPARTHDSFVDHWFVSQLFGIEARRT